MAGNDPYLDVDSLFSYHKPKGDQQERYDRMTVAAKAYASAILDNCPSTPERTLAIRKLQEARMWANASIALNEHDSP
jgi:hypothetical protein